MYKLPKIELYSSQMEEIVREQYPVIVFGNGMLGKAIVDLLLEMGANVTDIFDNNKQLEGSVYNGIKITCPRQVENENTVVIVSVYLYMEEITEQMKKLGVNKIYPYYGCFLGQEVSEEFYWNNDGSIQDASYIEKKKLLEEKGDVVDIDSVDITITEKCSLKCKHCANLLQYYTNPKDEEFEKISHAVKRLAECVDLIGRVSILGGEPLLCKDLSRYVDICTNIENIENILVVTNGTIVPTEELITALKKDNRCVLSVSNYGSISRNKEKIIELSRQEDFRIAITRRENGIWRELGKIEYVDLSNDELEEKWNECLIKKYLSIKDGKLFVCPFAANAYSLQAIPQNDVEYVDLVDETVSIEELRVQVKEFLQRKSHPECRYCIEKGKKAKLIPAAEQIKEPLPFVKYTYEGGKV